MRKRDSTGSGGKRQRCRIPGVQTGQRGGRGRGQSSPGPGSGQGAGSGRRQAQGKKWQRNKNE